MHLKVKDAFSLHHSRKRVLIEWNGSGQPIGESGGLLGGVLGLIASNFNNFPIMYKTWHKVPMQYKDAVFENTIKKIFVVNDDEHKRYILSNLGNKWKNNRCKLFNEHYKLELSWDANVNSNPIGISKDHWAAFLEYRLSPKTQELCEKNATNRQQLKIPHTLSSKTLARKRHELGVETGRQFSRGEMFSITHKKKDGTFVNEEAQQKNEDLQKEIGEGASENEAYVKIFGKENSSYVRGMGFGVRPSQMIGSLSRSRESMQSTTTSRPSRAEYQNLKLQVQLLQEQVNFLVNHQKGQLPPGFSTEWRLLPLASTVEQHNSCSFTGSGNGCSFSSLSVTQSASHPVVVVIEKTDFGKSTQLSQMLYSRGYANFTRIAVTQPRSVVAIIKTR
ncbi:uncharacterized protein [Arachis hypogaea]|uniref:uncharacterized protein n=1 Tax=Arachis hypogaea TaxID=3818 RepID=UPI003B21D610